MMFFPRPKDSRDFSPYYLSSAEWAGEDKTSSCALSETDVEGPAVAGSARFNSLKKEDIEEGPAVAGSARFNGLKKEDIEEGPAVAGSACLTGLKNE
ncbi:hypothetical protein E2C01_098808 [Portunus trituberculatus]|uniref:Uncharacterized protein n=1 Tax=Portunus trituberculatus TaxID=210409 RepID=A0A5B7K3V1_PORTR|nr:hypothetical protein [Portunus trituberculatus]